MPRVLVGCEMSGRVRTAFALRGWDAWSADLLPDETGMWNELPQYNVKTGQHYKGDVLDIIEDDWDLVIAHPPCTHLSQAGARYWKQKQADGRQQAAMDFFYAMLDKPRREAYVVVENPRGVISRDRVPDQVIQPWMFGDPLVKETCLWYRGAYAGGYQGYEHASIDDYDFLPYLVPTHSESDYPQGLNRTVTGGGSWRTDTAAGKTGMHRNWEDSQGRARRDILRSITPAGFASAAAEQWGSYIEARRAGS